MLTVSGSRNEGPRLFKAFLEFAHDLSHGRRAQAERTLQRILRRHAAGRVAVVVPGPIDRVIRWLVAAEPLGDLWACASERPLAAELPVAGQWRRSARSGQDAGRRRIPAQSRS